MSKPERPNAAIRMVKEKLAVGHPEARELMEWIEHLEENDIEIVRLGDFDPASQEILHGDWSEIDTVEPLEGADGGWAKVTKAGNQIIGSLNAKVAVRPKRKSKTPEDVLIQAIDGPAGAEFTEEDARKLVKALREAGMLNERHQWSSLDDKPEDGLKA